MVAKIDGVLLLRAQEQRDAVVGAGDDHRDGGPQALRAVVAQPVAKEDRRVL